MSEFLYQKKINIRFDTDVCVVGGGPAGIAAAISAKASGARVCLFEKEQCFGGAATNAKVPAFMRFSDGVNFLSGGVGKKVFDMLYPGREDFATIEFSIDTEKLKLIYDKLISESGIDFLFETTLIDVICENGTVKHAVFKGKEQLFGVSAKCFIDATGDGFLAVSAGADFKKGDENGNMMPATLCTLWGDIDWSRAIVEIGKDPDDRHLPEAFEAGVFTVKDPALPGMWRFNRHYGGGNIGHVFGIDGTCEKSITDGIIDARKRMSEYEYYYNHYLEGYENTKLLSTADVLGIRETRRIDCEYNATLEDYKSFAVFDDEIGRYCYPVDIHSHDPNVAGGASSELYAKGYPKGRSYGISYKSLIPKKLSNVLVCGRCIGSERAINASMRVMPCCFITGMAAGTAAAISSKTHTPIRDIDISALQKSLKDQGAFLPNFK